MEWMNEWTDGWMDEWPENTVIEWHTNCWKDGERSEILENRGVCWQEQQ